jgi:hypothetical protein
MKDQASNEQNGKPIQVSSLAQPKARSGAVLERDSHNTAEPETTEEGDSGATPNSGLKFGEKITKKQLLKTIGDLQKNPNDRLRILGDVGIVATGMGMGTLAAGTLAGMAGATSIPAATAAASVFGITVATATPVGWIVGAALIGSASFYGISRLMRNGALSEGKKQELLRAYQDRLREIEAKERTDSITPNDRNQFIVSLRELIEKNVLSPEKAFRLIKAVEDGRIPVSQAYNLVSAILQDNARPAYSPER